jgi:hypothetical protein
MAPSLLRVPAAALAFNALKGGRDLAGVLADPSSPENTARLNGLRRDHALRKDIGAADVAYHTLGGDPIRAATMATAKFPNLTKYLDFTSKWGDDVDVEGGAAQAAKLERQYVIPAADGFPAIVVDKDKVSKHIGQTMMDARGVSQTSLAPLLTKAVQNKATLQYISGKRKLSEPEAFKEMNKLSPTIEAQWGVKMTPVGKEELMQLIQRMGPHAAIDTFMATDEADPLNRDRAMALLNSNWIDNASRQSLHGQIQGVSP